MKPLAPLAISVGLVFGAASFMRADRTSITFLALGDSYTSGESVAASDRWPVQVVRLMREAGTVAKEPVIIARTGWTTSELEADIAHEKPQGPFDVVGLLIGVNNQFRGLNIASYRREFTTLLKQSIAFADGNPSHVYVLSIPDWGSTPFAQGQDRGTIGKDIDRFNDVNRKETAAANAHYIDITPLSRRALNDPSLIAGDGLHPSARMYGEWARLVFAAIRDSQR